MNRLEKAFKNKVLAAFLTAGDPNIQQSEEYILALIQAGVGLIEIGIAFSDPITEGPIVEAANVRALTAGTDLDQVFALVEKVRLQSQVPIVFSSFANPVYNFGYAKFFKTCQKCGVDGIVIPDLPYEERNEILPYAQECGVELISCITVAPKSRIQEIAANSQGLICVLPYGKNEAEVQSNLHNIVSTVREASSTPVAILLNTLEPKQTKTMFNLADALIVSESIVKIIAEETQTKNTQKKLKDYIQSLAEAI